MSHPALAAIAAGILTLVIGAARAAPHVPAADEAVLERLPGRPSDPAWQELRSLRAALAAAPRDPAHALALARRYFDLALAEGDPRYVGYAEAALAGLPETARAAPDALVVRAQLAQYRHEFHAAVALLEQALEAEPLNPEALAWSAAVRMVQADYLGARHACDRLARVASQLLGTGCLAHVAGATGELRAAYRQLLEALRRHPDVRRTLRLWTNTLLADMAQRLGDSGAADAHYRAALALEERDQYLLAAYAEFLLDERRAREAERLLSGWERSDVLLLLRARAAKALDNPEAGRIAKQLEARYAAAARRGERLHAQDEARFRLEFRGDAEGALELASQNWREQREGADARILMEAALAAKRPQAARPVLDWLETSRFEDPRLRALALRLKAMAR